MVSTRTNNQGRTFIVKSISQDDSITCGGYVLELFPKPIFEKQKSRRERWAEEDSIRETPRGYALWGLPRTGPPTYIPLSAAEFHSLRVWVGQEVRVRIEPTGTLTR